MDLEYHIKEGQKFTIEKIEIKGNVNTRDKVIRRELSVSPGDTFDMLQVKLSQRRLERLGLFHPGQRRESRRRNPTPRCNPTPRQPRHHRGRTVHRQHVLRRRL